MRTYCPVCSGKGTIDDPKCLGVVMAYCGRNGERVPQIICPNCWGAQFVGVPHQLAGGYTIAIDVRPKCATSTTEVQP